MTPEYITVHNTYNDASAMSEISYMLGNNLKGMNFLKIRTRFIKLMKKAIRIANLQMLYVFCAALVRKKTCKPSRKKLLTDTTVG